MSDIVYQKLFHAHLYYHVLSQVDLGRDAANLYSRPGLVTRLLRSKPEWAAPLAAALQASPAAMTAQILPLAVSDLRELRRWLDEGRRPFDDLASRDLAERLLWALRSEEVECRATFDRVGGRGMERFQREAGSKLAALLEALWDGRSPELTVVGCNPLTDGQFSHGRCYRTPVAQVVAVSFACSPVMSAIQILHEVTHAVTDPEVMRGRDPTEHSTAAGSAGHALHIELERAVIDHDAALIERVCPEWRAAYGEWCRRWRTAER